MEKLLSVKDVSSLLGVPEATIRYWVWTRCIRHYKLGRHIKFKENDIKAFLEENVREGEVMHLHHK